MEARLQARQREVQAQLAELKAWADGEDALDRAELAWFDGLLETYYRRLETDGKVRYGEKSYLLPNGQRIGYRWSDASWEVTDAAALDAWAKGHGLVRVTETADWGAQVKPRLVPLLEESGAAAVDQATGEFVPGVRLARPAGDVFAVTASRRRSAATEQPREG